MVDPYDEWAESIDWPATLRRMCSRLSMSPRADKKLSDTAERIYATAISAKDWDGLSDETYEAWAKHWWHVLTFMEEGDDTLWWD